MNTKSFFLFNFNLSTLTGVLLGFIPFLLYYYIIYHKYAVESSTGIKIFWYFFIFWSLYGIVALLKGQKSQSKSTSNSTNKKKKTMRRRKM